MTKKADVAATKKAATDKRTPTVKLEGAIPKMMLDMPVDARKIKAIQKCLDNGTLHITVSKVDLSNGRLGSSYLYD